MNISTRTTLEPSKSYDRQQTSSGDSDSVKGKHIDTSISLEMATENFYPEDDELNFGLDPKQQCNSFCYCIST